MTTMLAACPVHADLESDLALLPSFERTGAHTVKFVGETILDVSTAVEFCGSYKLVPYP